MKNKNIRWFTHLVLAWLLPMLASFSVYAQKAGIATSATEFPLNQPFSITLTVPGDLRTAVSFPDISGLQREGTSRSTSTTIINGVASTTTSITQGYRAGKQGKFRMPAFNITANGVLYKSSGKLLTVTAPRAEPADPFADNQQQYDPLEDFFSSRRQTDVKEHAFLSLDTDKEKVYLGEGFNMKLALYVADDNHADMDFYDLQGQLTAIIKKIKPANCWEENFSISDIEPRRVVIGGKAYTEYKIYQASFFPLNTQPIKVPAVAMKLVKYAGIRDAFFSGTRGTTLVTFSTKPVTVSVKDLPPAPYPGQVAVGDYRLEEHIGQPRLQAGTSTAFQFIVKGEGNLAAIETPQPKTSAAMEVYPPSVTQNILRANGRVTGTKLFTYLLQGRQPGSYKLSDEGFVFRFFNTRTARYDSLRSRITLQVFGNVAANTGGSGVDEGSTLSNKLFYLEGAQRLRVMGNIVLLVLSVCMAGLLIWRRKG